jgi:hypothetical protein
MSTHKFMPSNSTHIRNKLTGFCVLQGGTKLEFQDSIKLCTISRANCAPGILTIPEVIPSSFGIFDYLSFPHVRLFWNQTSQKWSAFLKCSGLLKPKSTFLFFSCCKCLWQIVISIPRPSPQHCLLSIIASCYNSILKASPQTRFVIPLDVRVIPSWISNCRVDFFAFCFPSAESEENSYQDRIVG